MSKRIALPGAGADAQVVLSDPDTPDVDRVYRVVVLSRSVKKQLAGVQKKIEKLDDGDDDGAVRLVCDQLNILLSGGDDAPGAGDLLHAGWLEDRVTDSQILGLFEQVVGAGADPT